MLTADDIVLPPGSFLAYATQSSLRFGLVGLAAGALLAVGLELSGVFRERESGRGTVLLLGGTLLGLFASIYQTAVTTERTCGRPPPLPIA